MKSFHRMPNDVFATDTFAQTFWCFWSLVSADLTILANQLFHRFPVISFPLIMIYKTKITCDKTWGVFIILSNCLKMNSVTIFIIPKYTSPAQPLIQASIISAFTFSWFCSLSDPSCVYTKWSILFFGVKSIFWQCFWHLPNHSVSSQFWA